MAPSLQAPFPIPPDPIITNFISMDIVANTLFSAGACPTMLYAIEELPDFTPCIAALVLNSLKHKGVDSVHESTDAVTAKLLAQTSGAIVAVSGATDIVTDGN
ncbi:hypothetical protein JHK87_055839 [Glycine soja]|nr:hypothetical protein JHK87_055839 [Glycine soja]